mmetsp:Transcript_6688/g.24346  ORF Transcript_6688/g.24346 Transcript_6688/m.24346 type:complete len:84 (-) Transcript_6688:116-367(-)
MASVGVERGAKSSARMGACASLVRARAAKSGTPRSQSACISIKTRLRRGRKRSMQAKKLMSIEVIEEADDNDDDVDKFMLRKS